MSDFEHDPFDEMLGAAWTIFAAVVLIGIVFL